MLLEHPLCWKWKVHLIERRANNGTVGFFLVGKTFSLFYQLALAVKFDLPAGSAGGSALLLM